MRWLIAGAAPGTRGIILPIRENIVDGAFGAFLRQTALRVGKDSRLSGETAYSGIRVFSTQQIRKQFGDSRRFLRQSCTRLVIFWGDDSDVGLIEPLCPAADILLMAFIHDDLLGWCKRRGFVLANEPKGAAQHA